MRKVHSSSDSEETLAPIPEPTKVTYSINDINKVLEYLSNQKYAEVVDVIGSLKTKGELS
jgi:hypothetical protein|tara:strand:- start:8571 stop:8750 length:180 start_codon:yes stop_codon:yes gene_type:complete